MAETWNEKLRLGLQKIDDQHREYFRRVDRLMDLCLQEAPENEMLRMLDFLAEYARFHFASEESLMSAPGYSEADASFHKSQHQWFTREIADLIAASRAGKSHPSAVKLTSLAVDWFQNHILKVDRKLVESLGRASSSSFSGTAGR